MTSCAVRTCSCCCIIGATSGADPGHTEACLSDCSKFTVHSAPAAPPLRPFPILLTRITAQITWCLKIWGQLPNECARGRVAYVVKVLCVIHGRIGLGREGSAAKGQAAADVLLPLPGCCLLSAGPQQGATGCCRQAASLCEGTAAAAACGTGGPGDCIDPSLPEGLRNAPRRRHRCSCAVECREECLKGLREKMRRRDHNDGRRHAYDIIV